MQWLFIISCKVFTGALIFILKEMGLTRSNKVEEKSNLASSQEIEGKTKQNSENDPSSEKEKEKNEKKPEENVDLQADGLKVNKSENDFHFY